MTGVDMGSVVNHRMKIIRMPLANSNHWAVESNVLSVMNSAMNVLTAIIIWMKPIQNVFDKYQGLGFMIVLLLLKFIVLLSWTPLLLWLLVQLFVLPCLILFFLMLLFWHYGLIFVFSFVPCSLQLQLWFSSLILMKCRP